MMGMTPHFTIRVWGDTPEMAELARWFIPGPRPQLLCDIEVDETVEGDCKLVIIAHRGLELIPQRMLTS